MTTCHICAQEYRGLGRKDMDINKHEKGKRQRETIYPHPLLKMSTSSKNRNLKFVIYLNFILLLFYIVSSLLID